MKVQASHSTTLSPLKPLLPPEPWEEPRPAPKWLKGPQDSSGLLLAQLPSSTSLSTSWETWAALHCSSEAPVSNRGSQEQRQTQEAASLAPSSLTFWGTGSPRSFLAPSTEIASFHTFSFWCLLPPGSGLPLAPQGPGPDSVPFTWFCPLPSPLPAPPPVQSVESANQSPAKVGQRGGRGSRD